VLIWESARRTKQPAGNDEWELSMKKVGFMAAMLAATLFSGAEVFGTKDFTPKIDPRNRLSWHVEPRSWPQRSRCHGCGHFGWDRGIWAFLHWMHDWPPAPPANP